MTSKEKLKEFSLSLPVIKICQASHSREKLESHFKFDHTRMVYIVLTVIP